MNPQKYLCYRTTVTHRGMITKSTAIWMPETAHWRAFDLRASILEKVRALTGPRPRLVVCR